MSSQTVSVDPFPEEWKLLGGRALSARILLEECDPSCDPLGPDNVLVMAPGVLSGTSAPTSGRISIGGKSPLTGGIKEANAGGNPGQDLMKLGYRAVVVKGQPADPDKRYAVDVDSEGGSVKEVPDCKGLWNYALIEQLAGRYPKTASFISIGPAGELRLTGASVACTDQEQDRHPARHAARGGLGAVMGSKGLKYVAVDPGRSSLRQPANRKEFTTRAKQYTKDYLAGDQMFKTGTSTVVPVGGMHNCMTGCIVKCSNVVHDAEGNYKTSALEFETLTLLGSNCAIASWEDVADLDRLCDEIGLDTVETGAAIAVYMDSGGMEWGDADGAKRILKEIAEGTDLGRAIGNGAVATGKRQKHHRVPAVKGQAIPAWDPRPLKATGITYCTSAMGADHTAGLIVNPGLPPEQWAQASQESQLVNAVCDSSGFCQFLQPTIEDISGYVGDLYGEDVTREQMADLGWRCLEDEWEFNRRAGFTEKDDVMPECMKEDPIGPAKVVWDVSGEIVKQAYERMEPREELFSAKATG
jgi:aldehyde:ferredoxin oxidoreductase